MRRLFALLLCFELTSCGKAPRTSALPEANRQFLTLGPPGSAYGVSGDIDAAFGPGGDLAVSSSIHVVSASDHRIWRTEGADWHFTSSPDSSGTTTRIVFVGDKVHAFVSSYKLEHWVVDRVTGIWRQEAPIGRDDARVDRFDVVANGSGVVIAFVEERFREGKRLVIADLSEAAPVEYHELTTLPGDVSGIAGPRLAAWNGEIHLAWGVTIGLSDGEGRMLHAFRSADGSWSSPQPLLPATGAHPAIRTLAMAGSRERLFIFLGREKFEAMESTDGRAWSAPQRFAGDAFPGWSLYQDALSATGDADRVTVAWIDYRIGEAHRRPVGIHNPFLQTDVLAISSTSPTIAKLAAGRQIRLTAKSGPLFQVVACNGSGQHAVVWFSRPQDGRADEKPEIGIARIPHGN
jgi:hypothetical protein